MSCGVGLLVCLCLLCGSSSGPKGAQTGRAAASVAARQAPRATAASDRGSVAYRVSRSHGLTAANAAHGLRLRFGSGGVSVTSAGGRLRLELVGIGAGASLTPLPRVAPRASANRVVYRRSGLEEWYLNGPNCLEQGFTLARRPSGSGSVVLALRLSGTLAEAARLDGGTLRLGSLVYSGLVASDATGRRLPARLELAGRRLLIRVDDRHARYPLTIDPYLLGTVHEYGSANGMSGSAGPISIAVGSDGNLWFVENDGNRIGKVTTSGTVTEYTLPNANSSPQGIAAGPDGNLWFTEWQGNRIGKITTSGTITEYSIPTATSNPYGIAEGPNNTMWFAEHGADKIGKIDTSTGTITEYSTGITSGAHPFGIAEDSDGNMWFAENGTSAIGKIDTSTGTVTEYTGLAGVPVGIAKGPDGNMWFADNSGNKVGKITPSGTITEYAAAGGPYQIAAGPDGNLWFTAASGNKIGMVTTAGTVTELSSTLTSGSPGPYGITAGPDGNVWFTEYGASQVAVIGTGVPGAPTGVSATAGNAQATVSWTAPSSDGGSAITGYTVTSSPDSKTCTTTGAVSCTVSGLTNGTAYTFTVKGSNSVGTGPASTASSSVTPAAPATAPGVVTGVTAVAGDGRATVSWQAPSSDGGSAITGYTVTSSPGGKTCTTTGALSCTVTGLAGGTAYTFTVTATNSVGTGSASTASGSVSGTPDCGASVSSGGTTGQSVTVPAGTFDDGVKISLTRLTVATGSTTTGTTASASAVSVAAGSTVVMLTVTSIATGQPITSFAQPFVIHFPAPALGTAASSQDDKAWTTIPRLAGTWLPPGQEDGYYRNGDGSVDIYTRHATAFALLAPAAPTRVSARLHGGSLTLRWQPGTGGGGILLYRVRLNGAPVGATAATRIALHAFAPHTRSHYQLVAVGQDNQQAAAVPVPITITPVARPHAIPRLIPRWAFQLLAWQERPAARRGPRPTTAPSHVPSWYWTWKRWRLHPWKPHAT